MALAKHVYYQNGFTLLYFFDICLNQKRNLIMCCCFPYYL